jgi:hypothetical protein
VSEAETAHEAAQDGTESGRISRQGRQHGPSSFVVGGRSRGGWRPLLYRPAHYFEGELISESSLVILDWICPKCHENIDMRSSGRMRCQKCGLNVREPPPRKAKLRRIKNWGTFSGAIKV